MFKIDFTGGNEELILQHYTFQKERANKIIRLTWEWLISGNIIESCFSSVKINARRLWKCFLHSFDIRCARLVRCSHCNLSLGLVTIIMKNTIPWNIYWSSLNHFLFQNKQYKTARYALSILYSNDNTNLTVQTFSSHLT